MNSGWYRQAGKMNINTMWDVEPFLALCDAPAAGGFTDPQGRAIFRTMFDTRSPGVRPQNRQPVGPTPDDAFIPEFYVGNPLRNYGPFKSLATGYTPRREPADLALLPAPYNTIERQYPNGQNINNTLLRDDGKPYPTAQSFVPTRLFQVPGQT